MRILVLASQSPRRKEILERAGFELHIASVKVSEILNENLSLDAALVEIAKTKGEAVVHGGKLMNLKEFIVLSADTMVIAEGRALGKPSGFEEAVEYLSILSGMTHVVKTAVWLKDGITGREVSAVETSRVRFSQLTQQQIEDYIRNFQPFDKAGAYGIQELPEGFLSGVEGEWDNIVGLPLKLVERILRENGWNVRRRER